MIQYPAVEESALYEACDRIYLGDDKASHFDLFSVAIVLAISVNKEKLAFYYRLADFSRQIR